MDRKTTFRNLLEFKVPDLFTIPIIGIHTIINVEIKNFDYKIASLSNTIINGVSNSPWSLMNIFPSRKNANNSYHKSKNKDPSIYPTLNSITKESFKEYSEHSCSIK